VVSFALWLREVLDRAGSGQLKSAQVSSSHSQAAASSGTRLVAMIGATSVGIHARPQRQVASARRSQRNHRPTGRGSAASSGRRHHSRRRRRRSMNWNIHAPGPQLRSLHRGGRAVAAPGPPSSHPPLPTRGSITGRASVATISVPRSLVPGSSDCDEYSSAKGQLLAHGPMKLGGSGGG
jgi:hypothetical protein